MSRLRTLVILIVVTILLLSITSSFVTAAPRGNPDISVFLTDDRVTAGEEVALGVQLLNGGELDFGSNNARDEDRVTTARNVRITLQDGRAPLDIETATQPIGSVPEGVSEPVEFTVNVHENATPGTYRVPVRLEYRYTDQILETGENSKYHTERTVTETQYVDIRVIRSARFAVRDASLDTLIDHAGTLTIDLQNIGEATARDARVEVTSHDPQLSFAGEQSLETFIGAIRDNETRTIDVDAELQPNAQQRSYPVSLTVTYTDADGEVQTSDTETMGVTFTDRREHFSVTTTDSSLAVGSEGQLRGTVVNTGTNPVRNAVVVFTTENPNVNPIESEYRVGDLEPEQDAPFSFDIDISDSAAQGPRLFTVEVRYRDEKNNVQTSDPIDVSTTVGEKRQVFSVEPIDTTVQAGGTTTVTLRTTNIANEPLSDVSAKLFANSPLSSSDDEAFISQLGPGESANITFRVSAGGDALAKSYPVSLDFQYDDADNDTLLSDTYRIPISVESPQQQNGLVTGLVLIVLIALALGGYYLYRQRT